MKANLVILGLAALIIGLGCYSLVILTDHFDQLFNQKNIKAMESGSLETQPIGSVTTEGFVNKSNADRFSWSDNNSRSYPGNLHSDSERSDEKSGEKSYQLYCLICHGSGTAKNEAGLADVKINQKGMVAPSLPSLTPFFSDNYIYLKIENGGTAMPRLGHIVEIKKRRDLIGYLRSKEMMSSQTKKPTEG